MELASISQSLTQVGSSYSTARCLGSFSESSKFSIAYAFTPLPKLSSASPTASRSQQQCGFIRDTPYGLQFCRIRSERSSAVADSPFTERYSPRKTHGRGLFPNFSLPEERNSVGRDHNSEGGHAGALPSKLRHGGSSRQFGDGGDENNSLDLSEKSAQLPELRDVLAMLRQRRREGVKEKRQGGSGNVFLVGTGPGDPELLTVKAVRLMQSADLVLYDRLVSADILDLVHAGARLLYVGKTSGYHSRTQEEIHELLLNFAEAGATVVRLKGGDPLVFGRGGEEMDFLKNQGIQVNVIPGITAASGIAAELGIPLTHRGAANSVRFLTGHSRKGGEDPLYVAEQAADPDSTLVIYMGLATLPGLAAKLMSHGLSPDVPAAAIERGTTPQQRTVFGTLEALPELVKAAELVSPTLIFIGKVVALSPLWPSNSCIEGKVTEHTPVQHPTLSRPAMASGNYLTSALMGEPRERRQRGPDPALPSQQ